MANKGQTQGLIETILKSIQFMIDTAIKEKTTKVYDALIISQTAQSDGTWTLRFNHEEHQIKPYGSIVPAKDKMVKVVIPQSNLNLAYFF